MKESSRGRTAYLTAAIAAAAFGAGVAFGCGGDDSAVGKSKLPDGVRSSAIEHESCSESGHRVELVDVNNDGKPDIRRVYDGNREVCRITDLNRDGKPDMFEYYDKTGVLRRREADYDDNGVVNAIEIYENGKLARRELDTTNQGRIDTWDFFDVASGNLAKRERDANGDGRIDQWWSYERDKVTIAMDRTGDGHPDPDATVVLGGAGGAPPGPPPSAPDAGDLGSSPPPATPTAAPDSPLTLPDAGVPGKPQRGGAKR